MDDIPRRNRLDECSPAELAIYKAMEEVEKAGADVLLTDAVTKLNEARNSVADFVDGIPKHVPNFLERLFNEMNEVDVRAAKLESFMNTEKAKAIDSSQRSLLRIQLHAMRTYSQCLLERYVLLQDIS